MAQILLTPPTAEPISLEEAKLFARIDGTDDDSLLASLIIAARRHVERVSGLSLVTQGWRLTLDRLPRSRLVLLPYGPVQSVSAFTCAGTSGDVATIAVSAYEVDTAGGRLRFSGGIPVGAAGLAGLAIDYTAGFGAPGAIPEPLRQAVRLLTAALYEDRGGEGAAMRLPPSVRALIAPWQRRRL